MAPREVYLTSTVVPQTETGDYFWSQTEFLFPHEAIRRELLRAEHALENADIAKETWKAYAFGRWYTQFFDPSIHAHHDAEEKIIGPHFVSLGADIDWGKGHTHKELLEKMEVVKQKVLALCAVADKIQAAEKSESAADEKAKLGQEATQATETLKSELKQMAVFMNQHLAEEEEEWPAIIEKYGREEMAKVVQKIINEDLAKKGPEYVAFKAFAGALCDAAGPLNLGFAPGKYPPSLPGAKVMGPWCSEATVNAFVANVPFVPRTFIFPGWHREYVYKWKTMIESVAGDKNVLEITTLEDAASSWCTIL